MIVVDDPSGNLEVERDVTTGGVVTIVRWFEVNTTEMGVESVVSGFGVFPDKYKSDNVRLFPVIPSDLLAANALEKSFNTMMA